MRLSINYMQNGKVEQRVFQVIDSVHSFAMDSVKQQVSITTYMDDEVLKKEEETENFKFCIWDSEDGISNVTIDVYGYTTMTVFE